MTKSNKYQKGSSLVLLLVFVMVAIAITTSATFIIAANSLSVTSVSEGLITKQMAESGIEKALLNFVRDPSYTGETFTIDTGTVIVAISGTTTLTIDAVATNGNYTKRVEVIAAYSNNIVTLISWKEKN